MATTTNVASNEDEWGPRRDFFFSFLRFTVLTAIV